MQDVAREQGIAYEPHRSDNVHRLNMGVFPTGAQIVPNPFNKIPGFFCSGSMDASVAGQPHGVIGPYEGGDLHVVGARGGIYFLPGFPVMAHPMMEWVLDTHFADRFVTGAWIEQSVIVFGAMEATLTPLMQAIERDHAVKVFSLPSVDHPEYGRHIELGVKGLPQAVTPAYAALLSGLHGYSAQLGPELVRMQ
jgi:molybdopterin-biosynthesis enzyme MoeA-like protein